MSDFETEQEQFWAGAFGDDYVDRSQGAHQIASRTAMWSRVLRSCGPIGSATEFGANVGLNLRALRSLLPDAELTGVEINTKAAQILREEGTIQVLEGSLLNTAHSDFALRDYGFVYHRDPIFPADDVTSFLMKRL